MAVLVGRREWTVQAALVIMAVAVGTAIGYLVAHGSWKILGMIGAGLSIMIIPSLAFLIGLMSFAQVESINQPLLFFGPAAIRPTDLLLGVLFLRVLVENRLRLRLVSGHWVFFFFTISFTPGLLYGLVLYGAESVSSQIISFARFMTYALAGVLLPTVIYRRVHMIWFLRLAVLLTFVQAIYALQQYFTGSVSRAYGTTSVADLGLLMGIFSVALFAYDGVRSRLITKVGFLFLSICMLLTVSKASFLATAAGALVVLVSRIRLRHVAALAAVVATPLLVFPAVMEQVVETISSSVGERSALAKAAFILGMESPVIGTGWSSFRQNSEQVLQLFPVNLGTVITVTEPHSSYAQFFLDAGFLGLSSFLVLMGFIYYSIRRLQKSNGTFASAMGTILLPIWVLFAIWLAINQILPGTLSNLLFWIFVGLVLAVDDNRKGRAVG